MGHLCGGNVSVENTGVNEEHIIKKTHDLYFAKMN